MGVSQASAFFQDVCKSIPHFMKCHENEISSGNKLIVGFQWFVMEIQYDERWYSQDF